MIEKARDYQREFFMCFIDYKKPFDCVDHQILILWCSLKDMGVHENMIVVLRNLYTNQESIIMIEYGETSNIPIGKGVGKMHPIPIAIQYLCRKNNARCPEKVG